MGVTFAGDDGKESEEAEKLTEKEILLKILERKYPNTTPFEFHIL